MNIQMIPLNRLIPSPANVRKTGAAEGIEELAASIAAHGLLQNLQTPELIGQVQRRLVERDERQGRHRS